MTCRRWRRNSLEGTRSRLLPEARFQRDQSNGCSGSHRTASRCLRFHPNKFKLNSTICTAGNCGDIDPAMSTPLQQRCGVVESTVRLGTQRHDRRDNHKKNQAEHDRIFGRGGSLLVQKEAFHLTSHLLPDLFAHHHINAVTKTLFSRVVPKKLGCNRVNVKFVSGNLARSFPTANNASMVSNSTTRSMPEQSITSYHGHGNVHQILQLLKRFS